MTEHSHHFCFLSSAVFGGITGAGLKTSRLLTQRNQIQHAESWIGLNLLCCCISYLESGPKENAGMLRKVFGYHNICLESNKNICVGKNIERDWDHFSFSCVKFSYFFFSSFFPTILVHRTPVAKYCRYSLRKYLSSRSRFWSKSFFLVSITLNTLTWQKSNSRSYKIRTVACRESPGNWELYVFWGSPFYRTLSSLFRFGNEIEIDKRAKLYGSDVNWLSKGLCLLRNTNQQQQKNGASLAVGLTDKTAEAAKWIIHLSRCWLGVILIF